MVTALPPVSIVSWQTSHRIIRSIFPRIDLFEDIADPADWALILSAEQKTNSRVRQEVGDLSLVPVERCISGQNASWVMAAFTHVSRDRPSRFSDGSYGIYYCGDRFEVAVAETVHHFERFMGNTNEPAGDAQYRELTAAIAGSLHDLRGESFQECLSPDDWRSGQSLGASLHSVENDGIIYLSVRWPEGQSAALFWPNVVRQPINQTRHLQYHWDGRRASYLTVLGQYPLRIDLPLVA
jgi:hypothetical protein